MSEWDKLTFITFSLCTTIQLTAIAACSLPLFSGKWMSFCWWQTITHNNVLIFCNWNFAQENRWKVLIGKKNLQRKNKTLHTIAPEFFTHSSLQVSWYEWSNLCEFNPSYFTRYFNICSRQNAGTKEKLGAEFWTFYSLESLLGGKTTTLKIILYKYCKSITKWTPT